jgi:hypothetical protein
MILRKFVHVSLVAASLCALALSQAQAQWTITTYKRAAQTPPTITTMAIADQYFTGAFPSRFMGTSTVTMVDLAQGTGGQFTINNPFPGLDSIPSATDVDDFTARITGTLVVGTAGMYNFFTDSDDGNRFRLDLNQNGTFEDATESIVPDGGLQGAGAPERSMDLNLAVGNYPFEVSFFERGGGANVEGGYRKAGVATQYALGDAAGGISLLAPAQVKTVGAAVGPAPPQITNFATAEVLRNSPQGPGFPATGVFEVFNIQDSGGDGDFLNDSGAPGLGAPNANDDDDFVVVGRGHLIVPAGGVTAQFRSNTDDGGRLLIDRNRDGDFADAGEYVINQDVLQGDTNTNSGSVPLTAGRYAIEYSWFERGGGGQGEVSVRLSPAGPFTLLGDDAAVAAGTGLEVALIPEPATAVLMALSFLGLAGAQRRRK